MMDKYRVYKINDTMFHVHMVRHDGLREYEYEEFPSYAEAEIYVLLHGKLERFVDLGGYRPSRTNP